MSHDGASQAIRFGVDADLLKSDLQRNIGRFSGWSQKEKKKTTRIEVFKGFSAAATTALLGVAQISEFEQFSYMLQLAAIVISASISIVTAWDHLFRHKNLWLINAMSRNKMSALLVDMHHAANTGTLTDELLQEFYQRYKQIWVERNAAWLDLRSAG